MFCSQVLYHLRIDDVPVGALVAYDFYPDRFVLCRKAECGGLKVIGHNQVPKPKEAFNTPLRVLEPHDEERALLAVAIRAREHACGWTDTSANAGITIEMFDQKHTVARVMFLPYCVGLLDVCLVYHEIASAISSRRG